MEQAVDGIEVEMKNVDPPARHRPEAVDPESHRGEYAPEAELLEILARLAGAGSWQSATAEQCRRVQIAVGELRSAGLSPRTIGLAGEARVAELQGMELPTARVARSKVAGFPGPAVAVRLWDEADVENHLRWRVQTAQHPRRFKNRFAPKALPGEGPRVQAQEGHRGRAAST